MKKVLFTFVSILLIAMCSCKDDENLVIAVSSIKINQAELSIKIDSVKQLSFTILPTKAPNKGIIWKSKNPEIASVSEKGLVTGIKEGSTIITVSTNNGKTSELKVNVSSNTILAESITIDKTDISLKESETQTIIAKILPTNTTDKTLVWSTSDKLIATVDKGIITAVKLGACSITAKTANNKTISCKVLVKSNVIQVKEISIDKGAKFITKSDWVQFKAIILPENADNKDIKWSTSDMKMGFISSEGGWLGKKAGTCTITATANNGVKASCELTYDYIAVTGAEIESPIKMEIGDKVILKPNVLPKNASNQYFRDEVKLTGEQGGIIHKTELYYHQIEALKNGRYTVTMYTADGNFPIVANIIVGEETPIPPFRFTLTKSTIDMSDPKLLIEMENVSGDINWILSDVNIATVKTYIDSKHNKTYALIEGLKAGETTITATLSDGSSDTCEITVTEETVYVTNISVGQDSYTIKEGEIVDLQVNILPENATNKDYTFSTWNKDIVSFENGQIKGLKAGNTNISLMTTDGSLISTGMISLTVISNEPVSEECIDADGRVYKTVVIANKTWMAENYAYLPKINLVTENSYDDARYYVYHYSGTDVSKAKETENYKAYGVLYNKQAALDNAPSGWHLPTDKEWKELEMTMGMTQEEADKNSYSARGTKEIANKFKSVDYWMSYYKGNNESGMNIRPAGKRNIDSEFDDLGYKTAFWCNTPGKVTNSSFRREFVYYASGINRSDKGADSNGFSVRYVKNK